MSARDSWRKARVLSASQRRVLCHALAMLPLTAAAVRVMGLRRTRAILGRLPQGPIHRGGDRGEEARDVARLVSAAARRGPYRANCLPTALALQSILRRLGIETSLCLGVRRAAAGIEAHAWVEHLGVPLIDDADVRKRFHAFHPIRESKRA